MKTKNMSAVIEEKIKMLPADCLEDISDYIDFLLYRRSQVFESKDKRSAAAEIYFGKLHSLPDGLTLQREMRNEWD